MPWMRSSISDFDQYRAICAQAATSDAVFATFKRQQAYNFALEHVPFEQGLSYLNYIMQHQAHLVPLFEKFRTNDALGAPRTFPYGNHGSFSPTTLRYIKVLGDLMTLFKDLGGLKIAEIGAGYGGQCKIISTMYPFASYTQVDLTECAQLQKKYFEKAGVANTRCLDMDGVRNLDETFDLVISNYAFTECTREIQRLYLDRIIKRSARGYITCNYISGGFGVDSLTRDELITELPGSRAVAEEPLTCQGNFILVWGTV
jgi:putative sugar O-methyltransferase